MEWEDIRHRVAGDSFVSIAQIHRRLNRMQKIIFLFFVVTFGLGSVLTLAQNVDLPPGAVIRMTNCTISDDRFNFNDVVERARASDFDENAPNMIWFRRPVYVWPEYQENWDFQIALYYSSYTEMIDRRVASGNNAYGRLPISCGSPMVVRSIPTVDNQGDGLSDQTAMLTRRCSLIEGASVRDAFNRLRSGVANVVAEGNNTLVSMWLPGLGGQLNRDFDFVMSHVGSSRQELTERMDMMRNGFRPNSREGRNFSCDRPSMWVTNRIYQASAN